MVKPRRHAKHEPPSDASIICGYVRVHRVMRDVTTARVVLSAPSHRMGTNALVVVAAVAVMQATDASNRFKECRCWPQVVARELPTMRSYIMNDYGSNNSRACMHVPALDLKKL